ncbi:hypothetical protein DID96_26005 [Burkholderia sp. Bp8963]|uniref:hypothetical protein n=1 Tax=Burkholderia sp. Bp8963 TaxID=2184547 RepID=UPI000F5B102D|nr:hypothetical protein [Burkholderia sp. Bp8963]RQS65698.1 hypothetical protein DID96_26005 [Burkholderia sp. Bp8963]
MRWNEINREDADIEWGVRAPPRAGNERRGVAVRHDMDGNGSCVVLRDPADRALEGQLIGVRDSKQKFPEPIRVDRLAKRPLDLRTRRHDIHDLADTLAPFQQLSVHRFRLHIERNVNDPAPGLRACAETASAMPHAGHLGKVGEKRFYREMWQEN